MSAYDVIELNLPLKPEYVSVARLTTAGILNRIKMDIETIEDVKVAVSEVCNKIIEIQSKIVDKYNIIYNLSDTKIEIFFRSEDTKMKCIFDGNELGLSLINALMDEVKLCKEEGYIISFSKSV
ncbi:MAG: ATP-binding protein [Clostridiales bacterium]